MLDPKSEQDSGEPEGQSLDDDPIDPVEANHLDAVRQALALDQIDDDLIQGQ